MATTRRNRATRPYLTNRALAASAAKKLFHSRTPEEMQARQQRAGTALLRQYGTGYYSALGKASAAARAAKARAK
jgi:hypothetical protein